MIFQCLLDCGRTVSCSPSISCSQQTSAATTLCLSHRQCFIWHILYAAYFKVLHNRPWLTQCGRFYSSGIKVEFSHTSLVSFPTKEGSSVPHYCEHVKNKKNMYLKNMLDCTSRVTFGLKCQSPVIFAPTSCVTSVRWRTTLPSLKKHVASENNQGKNCAFKHVWKN